MTSKIRTLKPKADNLGMWNAFCEDGNSQEERKLRINMASKRLQSDILKHLQLVRKLRDMKIK